MPRNVAGPAQHAVLESTPVALNGLSSPHPHQEDDFFARSLTPWCFLMQKWSAELENSTYGQFKQDEENPVKLMLRRMKSAPGTLAEGIDCGSGRYGALTEDASSVLMD
eukprot:1137660-Pelagomonas_calceolata.AAC.2